MSIKIKSSILYGLLFFIFQYANAADNSNSNLITLNALLATPEKFDAQRVSVQVSVHLSFEAESVCSTEKNLPIQCLSLSIDSGPFETRDDELRYRKKREILNEFNGKTIILNGIFDSKNKGPHDQWPATIRDFSFIQGDEVKIIFDETGKIKRLKNESLPRANKH